MPWSRTFANRVPPESDQRIKPRKPVLAQLAPVTRVREAFTRDRFNLYLQECIMMNDVGVPKLAHRPQRFQVRTSYSFSERASAGYSLYDTLPLPVHAPPTTVRQMLPPYDNTVDKTSRNSAAGRRWEELFNPGVLQHNRVHVHASHTLPAEIRDGVQTRPY